eukprot:TRINITY_DN18525_c0_g1_i7.p1 TRINITY_DN18525_c0_g1~~TRINITY_DN18525_c0_g1_i7.p1  ORF type:complete len:311 (-),score=48.60 TRINITY_DN18525_c0_g1_i7:45-956(-)
MAGLTVPITIMVMTPLFKLVSFLRRRVNLLDDGKVSRGEKLWEQFSKEGEIEALCLGLSFALSRAMSFFVLGELHDISFRFYGHPDFSRGWVVLFVMSIFFLAMGLGTFLLKKKLFPADSQDVNAGNEDEDYFPIIEKALEISEKTFCSSFAWGLMTCGVCLLNATMPKYRDNLLGFMLVAMCLSVVAVVMLLGLDKVADHWKTQAGGEHVLQLLDHCVNACALMVAFIWKMCFTSSMHAIGYYSNDYAVGIFLLLLVTPPYRLFMLPELKKRETQALEEINLSMSKWPHTRRKSVFFEASRD